MDLSWFIYSYSWLYTKKNGGLLKPFFPLDRSMEADFFGNWIGVTRRRTLPETLRFNGFHHWQRRCLLEESETSTRKSVFSGRNRNGRPYETRKSWTIDYRFYKNEAAQWRHHALKNYSKEINMGLEPTNPKETIQESQERSQDTRDLATIQLPV